MIQIQGTSIAGIHLIKLRHVSDDRGSMTHTFDSKILADQGINHVAVQSYHSLTIEPYILRGIHVSLAPYTEAKLITALTGKMFWVCVDLREGSPTFAKSFGAELSEEDRTALYVPRGFAHGCLSLAAATSVSIVADRPYSEEYSTGILWNDPDLNIEWPKGTDVSYKSKMNLAYPSFADFLAQHKALAPKES